jgi:LuxR family maltose regulon positive regulatory protein
MMRDNVAIDALTQAQHEVLRHVDAGLSNHEIASALGITVATVKWHLHQVFEKLGARNRTEAAAIARKERLLPVATAESSLSNT